MQENILEIKNLSKYFGGLAAVSNCSLKVKKGTITGIRSLGRSYDVLMDSGKTFLRNRSFLHPIHQTRTEDNSVPTATPSDDQKPTKPRRSVRLSNKKN